MLSSFFIPFNEAMIQGDLLYQLFDDKFISYRSSIHKVTKESYIKKLNDFINIKNNINEKNLNINLTNIVIYDIMELVKHIDGLIHFWR